MCTVLICVLLPDNKVHEAGMGPTWGRQDPGGPHVGPMNFAIRAGINLTIAVQAMLIAFYVHRITILLTSSIRLPWCYVQNHLLSLGWLCYWHVRYLRWDAGATVMKIYDGSESIQRPGSNVTGNPNIYLWSLATSLTTQLRMDVSLLISLSKTAVFSVCLYGDALMMMSEMIQIKSDQCVPSISYIYVINLLILHAQYTNYAHSHKL